MKFMVAFVALLVISDTYSQNVTFSTTPNSTTIGDGGNITFVCVPLVDGMPGLAAWRVDLANGGSAIDIFNNGTDVSGAGGYLSGDSGRTQLILTNVGMTLHGAQIVCRGTNLSRTVTPVEAPSATLGVHCIPTLQARSEPLQVGSELESVASYFNSSVGGCSGNVTITCIVGQRRPLRLLSNNGMVMHIGIVGWNRILLTDKEGSRVMVNLTCTADQDGFNSATIIPVDVAAYQASITQPPQPIGAIIGGVVGGVILIGVGITFIIIGAVVIVKKCSRKGSG